MKKWLRYAASAEGTNNWVVSGTSGKDANNGSGWAHCVEKGLHDPAEAATWTVLSGGEWGVQATVTCVHLYWSLQQMNDNLQPSLQIGRVEEDEFTSDIPTIRL